MELKEFIKETISGITDAVKDLQRDNDGAVINPPSRNGIVMKTPENTSTTVVDFNISLTPENKEGEKAGIGVFLGSVGIGGNSSAEVSSNSSTSIKFSLNIMLPYGKA